MSDHAQPLRVLHVVGAMNRGGIETWLMNVARSLHPTDVELTFLMHSRRTSDYHDEILRLGHRVEVCERPGRPFQYVRNLRRILQEAGPFDAIHSSVANFSALPLLVARHQRVPVRVAHSQTDRREVECSSSWLRKGYLRLTRWLILWSMTTGMGCTPEACLSLFGRRPGGDIMWLPNGIDVTPFAVSKASLREELGFGPHTLIVGHIARFVPLKNHSVLVSMAEVARDRADDVHVVLVGEGPEQDAVKADVLRRRLGDFVSILGVRSDIPDLLASFDVLMLPSRYEGAPITLLEAQASGVPSVVSDKVSTNSDVVPDLVMRLPLTASPEEWLEAALAQAVRPRDAAAARERILASSWNLSEVVQRLTGIWADVPNSTEEDISP